MKKTLSILLLILTLFLSGCTLFEIGDDFGQVNGCSDMNNCTLFSSGLLAVKKNDHYGYIDTSGEIVIDYSFDYASGFYGKHAIVKSDELYYLIDKEGNFITEGYDYLFRDKYTGMVIYSELEKKGLMSRDGNKVIEATYDEISPSSEKLFLIRTDLKYGFIDLDGHEVIEPEYDFAASYSYGLARIRIGSKYGYINSSNTLVIDAVFDEAGDFDRYHRAIVRSGTGTSSGLLIDQNGDPVLQGELVRSEGGPFYILFPENKLYDYQGEAFGAEANILVYYINGYYAAGQTRAVILNKDGSVYDEVYYYQQQRRLFIMDELEPEKIIIARINQEESLVSFKHQGQTHDIPGNDILNAYEFYLVISRSGKGGVVDYDNNILINFYYDTIHYTIDGYFLYEIDGKYGIMDKDGNLIVNAQFDDVNPDIN